MRGRGRIGIFRVVAGAASGEPAMHLELPANGGRGIPDYTTSLYVGDRVAARGDAIAGAAAVVVRALRPEDAGRGVEAESVTITFR